MREMCQAYNSFPSACCLPAWMLYMMKIRTNQLKDIIIQSSSQVLCHNWKLELMGLPEPVMCRSEHHCLEHALCFPAVPLVCHLHLKLVPLIKSHMSPQNNNFKNPSSSVPLNQSQTWQTVRMELGCLQAIKAGWETESGKQGSRAVEWAAVSRTSKRHIKDAAPHIHPIPLAQQSHVHTRTQAQSIWC